MRVIPRARSAAGRGLRHGPGGLGGAGVADEGEGERLALQLARVVAAREVDLEALRVAAAVGEALGLGDVDAVGRLDEDDRRRGCPAGSAPRSSRCGRSPSSTAFACSTRGAFAPALPAGLGTRSSAATRAGSGLPWQQRGRQRQRQLRLGGDADVAADAEARRRDRGPRACPRPSARPRAERSRRPCSPAPRRPARASGPARDSGHRRQRRWWSRPTRRPAARPHRRDCASRSSSRRPARSRRRRDRTCRARPERARRAGARGRS